MLSNGKLSIKISSDDGNQDTRVIVILSLPEVSKEIIYEEVYLEDFDSPEFVLDWLEDIKRDAVLLACDFECDTFEKELDDIFYSDFEEDDSDFISVES